MKYTKATQATFKNLFASINISDWHRNLVCDLENPYDAMQLGLCNPYSKISCCLLQLYSMEFGTPPLYCAVSRVAREMD